VAGPHELIDGERESFIGGYSWQRNGRRFVAQRGMSAVVVVVVFPVADDQKLLMLRPKLRVL